MLSEHKNEGKVKGRTKKTISSSVPAVPAHACFPWTLVNLTKGLVDVTTWEENPVLADSDNKLYHGYAVVFLSSSTPHDMPTHKIVVLAPGQISLAVYHRLIMINGYSAVDDDFFDRDHEPTVHGIDGFHTIFDRLMTLPAAWNVTTAQPGEHPHFLTMNLSRERTTLYELLY